MDKKDHDKEIARRARKAKAEYLEFVNVERARDLPQTMRLIDYMIKRMGYSTVITEQEPNWLLGHMAEWARREVKRATKKGETKR